MSSSFTRLCAVVAGTALALGAALVLPSAASAESVVPLAAAAVSGTLTTTNTDPAPSNSRVVLNRIQSPVSANQHFHNKAILKLSNTGTKTLTITSLTTTGPFTVTPPWALPIILSAGASANATVTFTATSGRWWTGNLAINSTSSAGATANVALAGYWQQYSEHNLEPTLAELVANFGYKSAIPANAYSRGAYVASPGDEVLIPYWTLADSSKSATVTQLAAWHGYPSRGVFKTFAKATPSSATIQLTSLNVDAQSALPLNTAWGKGTATFKPTGSFGIRVDNESSDPTLNDQTVDRSHGCTAAQCGHHLRAFKVRGADSKVIDGKYFFAEDFNGINYDFQDNVYLVDNIKAG